jgi:hypothetical protein
MSRMMRGARWNDGTRNKGPSLHRGRGVCSVAPQHWIHSFIHYSFLTPAPEGVLSPGKSENIESYLIGELWSLGVYKMALSFNFVLFLSLSLSMYCKMIHGMFFFPCLLRINRRLLGETLRFVCYIFSDGVKFDGNPAMPEV